MIEEFKPMSIPQEVWDAMEERAKQMEAVTAGLPRPLKPGEFFCWQCATFQKMEDHEKHNQECKGRRNL